MRNELLLAAAALVLSACSGNGSSSNTKSGDKDSIPPVENKTPGKTDQDPAEPIKQTEATEVATETVTEVEPVKETEVEPVKEPEDTFEKISRKVAYALVGTAADYGSDKDVIITRSADLINIPVMIQDKDVPELRKAIFNYAFDSKGNNPTTAVENWFKIPAEEDGYRTKKVSFPTSEDMFIWTSSVNGNRLTSLPDIFTYNIEYYQYAGGAHGMSGEKYFNYYIPTGKILTYNDLFTAGGRQKLPGVLLKQLLKNEPDFKGVVNISELPSGGDFYIKPDRSITFVYGEYEIGPYALGNVEIKLTSSQISPYLSPFGKKVLGMAE